MKRFALFAGYDYYPFGGWSDFVGTYDTAPEAVMAFADLKRDWYQVVDLHDGSVVATG